MSTNNQSSKSYHRITYTRYSSTVTSPSDDPTSQSKKTISTHNRSRKCRRSCDRCHSHRRLENYHERHRSRRDRHRITDKRRRSVTTSSSDYPASHSKKPISRQNRSKRCQRRRDRSRSCDRHHSHRNRHHRSESGFNERYGSRRSRSSNRRRIDYKRHSSTSSSDCRASRTRISTNRPSSQGRSCRTKIRGQRQHRSKSPVQPHSHQQSPLSESSYSNKGHRSRRSKWADRFCNNCNRDRSRTSQPGGHTLRKSILTCEKSTQTDKNVDNGYAAHPVYEDVCTGNDDYSHLLPDLTDYAFLDPLIADCFMNAPAEKEDNRLNRQNTNDLSNFDDADCKNQNVQTTLAHKNQAADRNGVNSLTNSEENRAGEANPQLKMFCRVEIARIPLDMKQLENTIPIPTVKNINPEWHSLSKKMNCKICEMCFNSQRELVRHYVVVHPTVEVFPSRVSPDVAEHLRSSKAVHQCKRIKNERRSRHKFEQFCYFCNQIKTFPKYAWGNHLASHTGCFEFEFTSYGTSVSPFGWYNVRAFLCDLCNYVRFSYTDMENHLMNEHGRDATNNFKEVIFLRFLRQDCNRLRVAGQINARVNWFKTPLNDSVPADAPAVIKNNNPDWHCLNKANGCIICGSRDSAAGHYVNVHPNAEVVISRLAPSVANFLRSLKYQPECKITFGTYRRLFEQYCYFCNASKCLSKCDWIDHIIRHSGYYNRQCGSCFKMLSMRDCSECKAKGTKTKILRQFEGPNLVGYLCDLCNFIRFDKNEIQNHLRNQHDSNSGIDDFEEIIFLTFPDHGKRRDRANWSIRTSSIVACEREPSPKQIKKIAGTNVISVDSPKENFGGKMTPLMPPGATGGEFND